MFERMSEKSTHLDKLRVEFHSSINGSIFASTQLNEGFYLHSIILHYLLLFLLQFILRRYGTSREKLVIVVSESLTLDLLNLDLSEKRIEITLPSRQSFTFEIRYILLRIHDLISIVLFLMKNILGNDSICKSLNRTRDKTIYRLNVFHVSIYYLNTNLKL